MDAILLTARTSSTRLPNKALLKLESNGMTTIEYLICRLKTQVKSRAKIILCTTTNKEDDRLVEIADKLSIEWYRGSENDKLARWHGACIENSIKHIVTVDGDDLFVECSLIDKAFEQLKKNDVDFIKGDHTGLICGSFTYGFTFNALERVINLKDDRDTEMMWVYFTETGIFKIEELQNVPDSFYRDDIRMTLDYKEDLDFFNAVIEQSLTETKLLSIDLFCIIRVIDANPKIKDINFFRQNEWKTNQEKKTKLVLKNSKKFIGNEMKYVSEIINSAKLSCTSGSWTKLLEKDFSKKHECKYGIAFNSGTSTMHAALLAAEVMPGDEVISPAFTVIMNSATTIHANGIPVYVDVDPDTFNIDPNKLEEKITSKTKAIFVVNVYGLPCDYDKILQIADKYNIPVIEDNAECVLSKYKGKSTGSFGAMASYSFENSKHISCGEGGMIITNNEKYGEYCRKMGCHGFKNLKAGNGAVKTNKDIWQNPNYERHDEIGWNYRMPEINSAVAYAQFERLEDIVSLRKQSANIFRDVIKDCDYLIPQKEFDDRDNSYWALGVKYYGDEKIGVSWYDFRQKYIEFGGDGFYGGWKVPYMEPVMRNGNFKKRNPELYKNVKYEQGLCPVAEEIQKRMMVFKTNYRNLDLARYKASCLKKTINYFRKSDNSDIVWKETKNLDFFTRQYDKEYESIKFIKNILKKLNFANMIDIGCGSGSLCYYLSQIMDVKYVGIDINPKVLDIARDKNENGEFILTNIFNYKTVEKTDLVISNQVLNIISPEKSYKFIKNHFELSSKYVVFFSLFTDSKLDINIKINDPYNDEVVYYNIVPIDKIVEIGNKYNYNIKCCENFEIKKELNKPIHKGRGTYTIKTSKNNFLQFSDVIYMPWKIIILEKS